MSLYLQDSFIEDIESILNSGTVVDLFDPDEFDALTMELKNDAYTVGMSDTNAQLREFFYQVNESRQLISLDELSRSSACSQEPSYHSLVLTGGQKIPRDLSPSSRIAQLYEYRLVHRMECQLDGTGSRCLFGCDRFDVSNAFHSVTNVHGGRDLR
jgi:hypothetical protein